MRFTSSYRYVLIILLLFSCIIQQIIAAPCTKAIASVIDTLPPKDTSSKIFQSVEQEAYFPGATDGWRKFLEQNLNANVPVDRGAPAGKYVVWVQFAVDAKGNLSDLEALTHLGYGMEEEVLRILRKSPPWVPAVQDQHNVRAYRKQPIIFMVTEEKKKRKKRS